MSVFAEVSSAPPIEVFQLSRDYQVQKVDLDKLYSFVKNLSLS